MPTGPNPLPPHTCSPSFKQTKKHAATSLPTCFLSFYLFYLRIYAIYNHKIHFFPYFLIVR